jgi:CubicO group peptidase (beta-lactamase class C family)
MGTATLPHSTPEAQGIRSGALMALVDALEREVQYLHSLVVLRRGHVVAEGYWEPFNAATPHMLFSVSKSFTSSAIGMLVDDGKLSLDDRVLDFFPDEAPAEPGSRLQSMLVRHLLTMATGHDGDPTLPIRLADVNWMQAFFNAPLPYEPGERFVYNGGASYMLSAIVQTITGRRVVEFLGPRLFGPLGFEAPTWETSPQGIDVGGSGLKIRTAELARFGQLYLQKGVWRGQRLVPEPWVDAATSLQLPNANSSNPRPGQPDWELGYGYQFWRCRHGAYRAEGANGQFCLVLPEQEAVVATMGGDSNLPRLLDVVWEHLLPDFGNSALRADRAAVDTLAARLSSLKMPTPTGAPTTAFAAELAGRMFRAEPNTEGIEAIAFEAGADGHTLVVRNGQGEQRVRIGYGEWVRGELGLTAFPGGGYRPSAPVAAAGAWTDQRTYVVHLLSYETPWRNAWTCRFDGDHVEIERVTHPLSTANPLPMALRARAMTPVA